MTTVSGLYQPDFCLQLHVQVYAPMIILSLCYHQQRNGIQCLHHRKDLALHTAVQRLGQAFDYFEGQD